MEGYFIAKGENRCILPFKNVDIVLCFDDFARIYTKTKGNYTTVKGDDYTNFLRDYENWLKNCDRYDKSY